MPIRLLQHAWLLTGHLLPCHAQNCMLLSGSLYWLFLMPKDNFSSLPASILGTNLFFFPSLLLGLCHGNH